MRSPSECVSVKLICCLTDFSSHWKHLLLLNSSSHFVSFEFSALLAVWILWIISLTEESRVWHIDKCNTNSRMKTFMSEIEWTDPHVTHETEQPSANWLKLTLRRFSEPFTSVKLAPWCYKCKPSRVIFSRMSEMWVAEASRSRRRLMSWAPEGGRAAREPPQSHDCQRPG